MVHFRVGGESRTEEAGHGEQELTQPENVHSFPFIKYLVEWGQDSEYLNHNCKQKWKEGLGITMTSSPPFSSGLSGPHPQHTEEHWDVRNRDPHVMGPKEAGSGKISLALPLRLIVINSPPSAQRGQL